MKSAPASATDLQVGLPARKRSRGAFKPKPEALAAASRKYAAAQAAVAVAITGSDLKEFGARRGGDLVASIFKIEQALALYVATSILGVSKKVLAPTLGIDLRRLKAQCQTIEAWRASPVISDALDRVEKTLPRSM